MEPATESTGPRAHDGDFAGFYRVAYPGMVRLAWLLTHDEGLAEDVVQDAFTHLHDRFATLDRPEAYLRVAVVNGCRADHRRAGRHERRLRLVEPRPGDAHADAPADPMVDALGRLPVRQRAALVLRYWADLPEADIAEALGVRPATVRSLVARGLEALRKELPR